MKKKHPMLFNVNVVLCMVPCTLAVINVTLTGTTTRHVCKGQDIDFRWTYDDTDPDKDFIKTVQWSKDPSGYLIMHYESNTNNLSITSDPNDYTGRVERTTAAGSNDIGMRLKQAGSTDVDDEGKYYVSLIVDKPGGDADDYFVPYREPQGVQVYVCVGVDDTFPLPSLTLAYDENTHVITCSGPSSLGNTTFAIFDPSMTTVVESTTDTTISKELSENRPGGTYRCTTYCTQQGYNDKPKGPCLASDATLVMPGWSLWGYWTSCTSGASWTRTRTCTNPAPDVNGPPSCPGVSMETDICPTPPSEPTTTPPSDCDITCLHGGTLDADACICDCSLHWSGDQCENCDITCLHGGTFDADICICDCLPHWSGDQCEKERTTQKYLTTEVTTDRLEETTGKLFETLETRNPFLEPSVMWPIIGAVVLIVLIIAVTVIVIRELRHTRANSERVGGTLAQQVDNELNDISGKSPTKETYNSELRDIEHQYQVIGDTNDLQNTVTRKTEYENTGIYEDTMANTYEKPDPTGREQYVNTTVYQSLDKY